MRIGVLGPMLVTDPEARVVRVGSAKQRTLLAHLVCQRPTPLSVDAIVDVLWDESPPASARQNVHLYIHRLRRALGDELITNAGIGYVLSDANGLVDTDDFEFYAARGHDAWEHGRVEDASHAIRAALTLWRGEPYAGVDPTARITEEAVRLQETYLALLERNHDAELAMGRHTELIPDLMTLTERYPLRERFTAQLMIALYQSGRSGDALDAYRTAYRQFTDQLGLEPTPELRDLERAVLTDDPALLGPARVTVSAAGQLGNAGSPTSPTTFVTSPVPAELPRNLADFTGRDDHVRQLSRDLDGTTPTILAISGMGGVGKTTLALHAAHANAADYPDGQLYADLQGTHTDPPDAGQVLHRLLRSLGVPDEAVPRNTAERAALYRTMLAKRRMIVVLDNAASEQQIRPLLPGTAACGVLVTSRTAMAGLEGARHLHLDVFTPDEATALLERIVGAEPVRADPKSAARIAELCGYVPLAIRIAGARLARRPHWRLAEMARLLDDELRRLDELSTGDLEIRSCFALSYRALPEPTQRAFRLLGSLNVPTFPWWAASAVLDVSPQEARERLDTLVDTNLLSTAGTDATGEPRYRIPNLVAIYANERSAAVDTPGDRAGAFQRAAGGWLYLAERLADVTPGPCYATLHGDALRWPLPDSYVEALCVQPIRSFDTEAESIIDVIRRACAQDAAELAWDLAVCLERYFDVRARTVDWRHTYDMALAACQRVGNVLGEAALRRGLAELDTWANPDVSATVMYDLRDRGRRIFDLFSRIDEPRGQADALVLTTWSLISHREIDSALETAHSALNRSTKLSYLGGQARAHQVLGVAEHFAGRTDLAHDHLTEALQLARQLGNVRFEITAMQFLGAAETVLDLIDDAHEHLTMSLAMAGEIPDPYAEAFSLLYLGRLYAKASSARVAAAGMAVRDTSEAAKASIQRALSISRRYGFGHHAADALTLLGELELADGDPRVAHGMLEEAVSLWHARGWHAFLTNAEASLARARDAVKHDSIARADKLSDITK